MVTLTMVALALAALVALGRLPPPTRSADRAAWWRRGVVAFLLLLPLLHTSIALLTARERLEVLRFDYVGKQLAFSSDTPLTAGGSPWEAETVEDLHAARLPTASVNLTPVPAEAREQPGWAEAAASLTLASPSPAVRLDGTYLNSVPLVDGDEIVIARPGDEPERLRYQDDALHRGGARFDLQGLLETLFGQSGRAAPLETVGGKLGAELRGELSFLYRPGAFEPHRLLIRSDRVTVERGGQVAARFETEHPVPASFELSLDVVINGSIVSRRRDELHLGSERAEIRFARPWRWALPLEPRTGEVELALTVPSAFSRDEMIELPESSPRFRGLSASYRFDRATKRATLDYFGDVQEVEPGGLYALGAGDDRMLLRLDHHGFPFELLFDLALLALFLGVFLGPGMVAHGGLAAVVAPVGLLLGHRLLFAFKAATRPPGFAVEPFQEARLALWLVPAFLVAAWAAAWLLRRQPAPNGTQRGWKAHLGLIIWPLAGLAAASVGCWAVTVGAEGSRQAMALLPLGLAALVTAAHFLLRRPRLAARLARLRSEGFPWKPVWLLFAGGAILAARFAGKLVGMPETLRFPLVDFRLLWTVVQLPLAAALVGLAVHALAERSARERAQVRPWLEGMGSLWGFLGFAFLGVGLVVSDTGLLLAHGLAPIFALLLLVFVPLGWKLPSRARAGLAVLPALPLAAVLFLNVSPETLVRLVGWGAGAGDEAASEVPVRAAATQLGSSRAQGLFRLYMLARPEHLSEVGLIASERAAIHYQTLQSYAEQGGSWGQGFLAVPLPRHLGITYLSDLVPMVFVLPDFGTVGLLGLALLYLGLLLAVAHGTRAVPAGDRLGSQGHHVALVALLALAVPSLYMILANLNLVLFTGKNLSLLSLNSLSDVLESGALAALAVVGLGARKGVA